nr:phosphoribosyltransferase family protein [Paracoccus saliphilus]
MNYRSLADLNDSIVRNLHRLPRDIDLVVGIPRSGLLAANLLSLVANIPLTDLDSFLDGRLYTSGTTKRSARLKRGLGDMRRILILDDSINSGEALTRARERVEAAGVQGNFIFAAVYGAKVQHPEADFIFERVKHPRMFQWNFMHHGILERSCVDIDGVLCLDPTEAENDDGEAYRRFLDEALPLHVTSQRVGWLVTSRLEKYRAQTESWLKRQGIEYGELVMLDLPSKAERQRLNAHGGFKGEFYRNCDATLFIESEEAQAIKIAQISGKPVLCVETHHVYMPDALSPTALRQQMRNLPHRLREGSRDTGARWKGIAREMMGENAYQTLKNLVRPQPRN